MTTTGEKVKAKVEAIEALAVMAVTRALAEEKPTKLAGHYGPVMTQVNLSTYNLRPLRDLIRTAGGSEDDSGCEAVITLMVSPVEGGGARVYCPSMGWTVTLGLSATSVLA